MPTYIAERGPAVLRDPLLNKGTAFSYEEKERFKLFGLLPSNVETIEDQLLRCRGAFSAKHANLEKHIYLRALQDRNEVLFYRFILDNLEEMLPLIYTPVVGEACEYFHRIYRQPRGLFISYPERDKMDGILSDIAENRTIRVIVITDGERILGLGDQGTGGLAIPIGKLSLYSVCGGIHPAHTLPILLDVGTNNQTRLTDPEYLGWRHPRLTGYDYDTFVEQFMQRVKHYFPDAFLQFEDFAQQHANELLARYRHQMCSFNDDIQGTAAVTVAALIKATRMSNLPLTQHRIVLFGAGSAGCGISEHIVRAMITQGLSKALAHDQFYLIDQEGLLHDGMKNLKPFQQPFARSEASLTQWKRDAFGRLGLAETILHAKPTILIGVSGQPNQFTEPLIRSMASYCQRPIIFPLSNPTSRAEATPQDIIQWTAGTAIVATGSPFGPLSDETIDIAQCNNAYIFPGLGLGIVAAHIKRVTDGIIMAAAMALSAYELPTKTSPNRLLPPLSCIRDVSQHIATAVIHQAIQEGLAPTMSAIQIKSAIEKTMWYPHYDVLS